ncbi:VOC family protein [Micromonospora zhanjiangensis]|uniref:VOC family protein n=1 Tax=Micromonospora zhanjiangensis TaxID=1522057 RepID=A0ABV8KRY9_9ACTN
MNITHTRFVTVPVTDQDRARAFYVDTLGFEVVVDRRVGPVRWIQVAPKGAQTSFTLATAAGFEPGSAQGIVLESADLEADCARLTECGALVKGPTEYPWGRQAVFTDPDGNRLVLATPTPVGF